MFNNDWSRPSPCLASALHGSEAIFGDKNYLGKRNHRVRLMPATMLMSIKQYIDRWVPFTPDHHSS